MKIGILGSGRMGGALGRIWAACGHEVCFAYARSAQKLDRLAQETGGHSAGVAETVAHAEALLLAVHWSRVPDVLAQAGDMAGKLVLNCCVPLDATDSRIVLGGTTSGAEDLARRRPAARWVSCFNTVPSESLGRVFARRGRGPAPQALTCADDGAARAAATPLIRDTGFAPLDCGGLSNARFVEPFAMVTAELAYAQPGGPALTYVFTKLRG
ncbi:transmembrane reductase oxidoreductase [Pseudooceanicola sp. GBMRC 2024]|uniref:Transmembrane reductase oxidoreductase n=1 Tax=Pseudooceanicola albus TaxID=2692189 RepID=A0A6L7G011_9RHOB|nr:NAD(P)-binding domain-containing protein [Pseudooceanicola albus]MXN16860.1 transmembrane reductase oxidoreductase [Pseudooceanicola albus]